MLDPDQLPRQGPRTITFGLPDNGYVVERASYSYDSAQRASSVRWQDETHAAPVELFTATGRPMPAERICRMAVAPYGSQEPS